MKTAIAALGCVLCILVGSGLLLVGQYEDWKTGETLITQGEALIGAAVWFGLGVAVLVLGSGRDTHIS